MLLDPRGLPPYHPLVIDQGWDSAHVDSSLRNETLNMMKAGYNVDGRVNSIPRERKSIYWQSQNVVVVLAGTEVPMNVLEDRIQQFGVKFDLAGIGYGIRGTTIKPLVERLEGRFPISRLCIACDWPGIYTYKTDSIDLFKSKLHWAYIVFNYDPESFVWSVRYRIPTMDDCTATSKMGRLLVSTFRRCWN